MRYFESYVDGGFIFIANPSTTLSSSGCCYEHLFALKLGGFIYGSYSGTFTSTCSNNVTDNTPSNLIGSSACGYDEYYEAASSTCISKFNLINIFRMRDQNLWLQLMY